MRPRRSKPKAGPPHSWGGVAAGDGGALAAGLRLLARRAHSCLELRRKLSRRGYEEDDISDAVARLTELGYLDDASFAAGHVRRRSVTRGPLALSAELALKGVDRDMAEAALSGFDRPAQLAAATALAGRLAGHTPGARRAHLEGPAGYRELLGTVGAKLVRRGFSIAVAQEACRAVWTGTESTSEP